MWEKNKRQAFLIEPASCWVFFNTASLQNWQNSLHCFRYVKYSTVKLWFCNCLRSLLSVHTLFRFRICQCSASQLNTATFWPNHDTEHHKTTRNMFHRGRCVVWWRSNVRLEFPFFTFVCIFSVLSADSPEEQVITRVPLKVIKHQHPEVTGRAPQLVTWPEKKQKKHFCKSNYASVCHYLRSG